MKIVLTIRARGFETQGSECKPADLAGALQNFDRALDRPKLALSQAFEPDLQTGASLRNIAKLLAAFCCQAQRQTAAIVRVLRALNQSGPYEHVHGTADRGRAAPNR